MHIPAISDITPTLLIIPIDGKQKYPVPLSFNDTFTIVSTLVTTSPLRVLFILDDILAGELATLNQRVLLAALLVLLSKTTQLNTALFPSQNVLFAGC